jgi:hypothetical protein
VKGEAIRDVAKKGIDALRDAEEHRDEFEMEMVPNYGKKKSFAKTFVFCIVTFILMVGAWKLLTMDKISELIRWMRAYKDYVLAVSPIILMLMGLIGVSRGIRHTKWSKDL